MIAVADASGGSSLFSAVEVDRASLLVGTFPARASVPTLLYRRFGEDLPVIGTEAPTAAAVLLDTNVADEDRICDVLSRHPDRTDARRKECLLHHIDDVNRVIVHLANEEPTAVDNLEKGVWIVHDVSGRSISTPQTVQDTM